MTDTTEKRLTELATEAVYSPAVYDAPKEGQGRWAILYAQGGDEQLGYLWTGDNGSMGFVGTSDKGLQRTAEFYQAFSRAAKIGTPAAEVFDNWAGLAGLGLSAGPVSAGDLDTLPA